MINVEIIATGDELLRGLVTNTSTPFLVEELLKLGCEIKKLRTVGDNKEDIIRSIREALMVADLIIITGGLGPTPDDVTREALAEAIEQPLEFRRELWEEIQAYFKERGREVLPSNINQAYLPYGSRAITNPRGTAPGIIASCKNRLLIALPGPPGELRPMFEESVRPLLAGRLPAQTVTLTRCFKVCGIGETVVLERLQQLREEFGDAPVGFSFLPKGGEVHLICKVTGTTDQVGEMMEDLDIKIKQSLGKDLFGIDSETLEGKVGELLLQGGLTLGVAESCTGGLVASYLTDVPGSSRYLKGAIVSYSNWTKEKVLGVKGETLGRFSEVSSQTAEEMAIGVRKLLQTDLALATTGYAGPGGGNEENPVGTVYVGLATPHDVLVQRCYFPGLERRIVKMLAAKKALDILRRYLLD